MGLNRRHGMDPCGWMVVMSIRLGHNHVLPCLGKRIARCHSHKTTHASLGTNVIIKLREVEQGTRTRTPKIEKELAKDCT